MSLVKVVAAGLLALSLATLGPAALERASAAQARIQSTSKAATLHYGSDPAQALDFLAARTGDGNAPLVLFVHGGGWTNGSKDNATGRYKASHYTQAGYAFATIDYRLVPQATVEQQAQDVADALAHLLARAPELGIDPDRVVLMGHSAGAHLVALVGTDPQYMRKAGLSLDAIDGIVALDGAAYDVPRQVADNRVPLLEKRYAAAFGSDAARQRALSPTLQASAPNAGDWLIVHVDRADGKQQAEALAAALRKAGDRAQVQPLAGRGLRGHAQVNRSLGDPDYEGTPIVDAWLARVLR